MKSFRTATRIAIVPVGMTEEPGNDVEDHVALPNPSVPGTTVNPMTMSATPPSETRHH